MGGPESGRSGLGTPCVCGEVGGELVECYSLGMNLQPISCHNKDGWAVGSLRLAHNQWDPVWQQAKAEVIHPGRPDGVDEAGVEKLGFRQYGPNPDKRPDLPQVLIGMAVTREEIPIRARSWPGSAGGSPSSVR